MNSEQGNILVVDDDPLNLLRMSRDLEKQGHAVTTAADGAQALELLRAESFDVVLLDLIMPEMDGRQVLERIKQDGKLRDIPVIVISALDDMDSVVECIEKGAEDYLTKPFKPALLRARLNASLSKKKLRDLEVAYLQQEVALRQNEKFSTLGKLSAGVAHEINNPAAAAQRGAKQLMDTISQLEQARYRLGRMALTPDQSSALAELESRAKAGVTAENRLDPLTRSDREHEIESLLDDNGLDNAWEYAPILVDMSYEAEDVAMLSSMFAPEQIETIIATLSSSHVTQNLLEEIYQGTGRITEIVRALKMYTYLDQAPVQFLDVHEGLDNTLVMLRSKLKQGVTVHCDYADNLPSIQAHGSELNQVWTNIIDNAIDAMNGHGDLTVRTRQENSWVIVEISDTGPGIPEEIMSCIFDPFFTTKPLGQGTGLGLNISHNIVVQQHHGEISVRSQPGATTFTVKLPLHHGTESESVEVT